MSFTSKAPPAATYSTFLENCKPQALATADRPMCAAVTALANIACDRLLGGTMRNMGSREQIDVIATYFCEQGLSLDIVWDWAYGITRAFNTPIIPKTVGPFTLDPYQIETIQRMAPAGGVMSLGCGLGKTLTAIGAAQRSAGSMLRARTRCWIVCPLNAMGTWKRARPLLTTFTDVEVISMDSIHKIADATPATGGVIIFDEAHLLGQPRARRTKAAHKLRLKFAAGYCLTGTLLHGGIEQALSIQDLAIPGLARFSTRWAAGEYFNCLAKTDHGMKLMRPVGIAKERFMEYVSLGTVSMTKDSTCVRKTMEIPEQEVMTVEIGDCSRDLDMIAVDIINKHIEATGEIPHAQHIAHALCREGAEQKLEWIAERLDDPDEQVVILCMYRDTLDLAEQLLKDLDVTYVRVDGDVTGDERVLAEKLFQEKQVQVFLGQQTASCISMNLQNASVSILVDHDWKAANYDQALARTCRRGQKSTCLHIDLISNKLQRIVVSRLRQAADFDASVAEYQELRRSSRLRQAADFDASVAEYQELRNAKAIFAGSRLPQQKEEEQT